MLFPIWVEKSKTLLLDFKKNLNIGTEINLGEWGMFSNLTVQVITDNTKISDSSNELLGEFENTFISGEIFMACNLKEKIYEFNELASIKKGYYKKTLLKLWET